MIKTDLGKLDKLVQVFYEKALAGCIQNGLLAVRIWERKHELLGMNSAAKTEIVQAPPEAPDPFDKIYAAIKKVARRGQLANGAGIQSVELLLASGCPGDTGSGQSCSSLLLIIVLSSPMRGRA